MLMENNIPKGLKIISSIYYFVGVFIVITSGIGLVYFWQSLPGSELAGIYYWFFISLLIPIFLIGGLLFFIGRGLKKRQRWARIVAIILALAFVLGGIDRLISLLIGSLESIFLLFSPSNHFVLAISFISTIFNFIAGAYLIFSNEIRNAFSNKKIIKNKLTKNRKYIYVIVIILIISIYSIYAYKSAYQRELDLQAQQLQAKPQIPPDLKYLEKELSLEIKNCRKVSSDFGIPASRRDLCYYDLAMEFKNPRICLEIESHTFVNDCYGELRARL